MTPCGISITGDYMNTDPIHVLTIHRNCGKHRLRVGATCSKCGQPLKDAKTYTLHRYRTAGMPASAFDCYHVACAKQVFKQDPLGK